MVQGLGAGTGGTIMANRLRRAFPEDELAVTVVDRDDRHIYQPGLLFLPFGRYTTEHGVRPRSAQLDPAVRYIQDRITRLDPATDTVMLGDGRVLSYDVAVIATGARIAPEELEPLARQLGGLVGRAHRRGATSLPRAAWSTGERESLLERATRLAGLHEAAYLAMCRRLS